MRLILSSLVAVAACGDAGGGDGGTGTLDATTAGDASASTDAQPSSGLTVTWSAQPAIPGPIAGAQVSSVKLRVARLEVIGDTGSSTATTKTDFDVIWSAITTPFPINFFAAEPGLYSKVSLQIDGKVVAPSYEILGTVVVNGTTEAFKISDTAPLAVDINGFDLALMAGDAVEVPIRMDLDDAIDAVDFATLPTEMNVRTMDQNTNGIAAVRAALAATTFVKR